MGASSLSKTVVFVPGAWMTPACWDNLKSVFEGAGYTAHTPAWPLLDTGASAADGHRRRARQDGDALRLEGLYVLQKASHARTDFVQFPGLSHFLIGEPGWESVAQHRLDWAEGL